MMNITNEMKKDLSLHAAWMRGERNGVRLDWSERDLSGFDLTRAFLRRAQLSSADLSSAILTGADLSDANLTGANLSDANLIGADLSDANLTDADLTDAILTDAILIGADLSDANLTDADLTWAILTWAKGIIKFGPVGEHERTGYAVDHGDMIMVKLGCFWGTKKDALEAISEKYGENSEYAAAVEAACTELKKGTGK